MFRLSVSLAAMAALLAACSASAQNLAPPSIDARRDAPSNASVETAHHAENAISCDIRSRRTANGVLIQARAFADHDIDGEYDLAITKSGGGGSAEINQSGPLTLEAGAAATLGENEVSIERGSRLRAVLTLYNQHGQLCRSSFRL